MLTNTCQCAQTQTAYTCCANIQECTHTLTCTHTCTHKYIHTLTKIHMLTETRHAADSRLCTMLSPPSTENKELCPPPPCPATTPARCTYRCRRLQLCCSSITCASIGQSDVQGCVKAAVKQWIMSHTNVFDVCLKVQETASQFQRVTHTHTQNSSHTVTVQNCKWQSKTALTV